jgi:glycosyltransferase involved in cell wall biosynthesis
VAESYLGSLNVICLSDVAWNFLWQRQHQLVSRFPNDWKILYIEPSFWKAVALRIINFCSGIKTPQTDKNIKVESIPTLSLFDQSRIIGKINDFIFLHILRYLIRKHDLNHALLIIYNTRLSCLLGKLGESLSCYEVIDERLEFEAIPKWLESNHKSLINDVNFITVSGRVLHERISSERVKDVYIIGNGVNVSHFKRAMLDIDVPADIRRITNPILGYIGAIGEWFDFVLLEDILKTYPKISVVLIGWAFNKQRLIIDKLVRNYSNLFFLGRRSYESLPSYVKAFNLCIIPFRVSKLTNAINPTKFYEYMAAGKMVISTRLPELTPYCGVVYIAENGTEFLKYIDKALNTPYDPNKLLKIACDNDWESKARRMIEIIELHKDSSTR